MSPDVWIRRPRGIRADDSRIAPLRSVVWDQRLAATAVPDVRSFSAVLPADTSQQARTLVVCRRRDIFPGL